MNSSLLNGAQVYLDFAGALIVAINMDKTIRFINKKACEVLGYAREEMIGKNWFEHFLPEENRDEAINVFTQVLNGNRPAYEYYENTLLTKTGEVCHVKWQNSIITDDNGQVAGTFSSGEDITENKLLLKQLADQARQKRRQLIAAVLQAQELERSELAHELHDPEHEGGADRQQSREAPLGRSPPEACEARPGVGQRHAEADPPGEHVQRREHGGGRGRSHPPVQMPRRGECRDPRPTRNQAAERTMTQVHLQEEDEPHDGDEQERRGVEHPP